MAPQKHQPPKRRPNHPCRLGVPDIYYKPVIKLSGCHEAKNIGRSKYAGVSSIWRIWCSGPHLQPTGNFSTRKYYTTWKVDGATPISVGLSWLLSKPPFWELRHLLSPRFFFCVRRKARLPEAFFFFFRPTGTDMWRRPGMPICAMSIKWEVWELREWWCRALETIFFCPQKIGLKQSKQQQPPIFICIILEKTQ